MNSDVAARVFGACFGRGDQQQCVARVGRPDGTHPNARARCSGHGTGNAGHPAGSVERPARAAGPREGRFERAWPCRRLPAPFAKAVERGEDACFALEAGEPIRIRRDVGRKNLDRDLAPELRVMGPVCLAHAALPEQSEHLIGADSSIRQIPVRHSAGIVVVPGTAGTGEAPPRC